MNYLTWSDKISQQMKSLVALLTTPPMFPYTKHDERIKVYCNQDPDS